jgi:hypothetical protein
VIREKLPKCAPAAPIIIARQDAIKIDSRSFPKIFSTSTAAFTGVWTCLLRSAMLTNLELDGELGIIHARRAKVGFGGCFPLFL